METKAGIFKAYDIRGVYPGELDEKIVYNIGRAIVQFTGAQKVVVGRDMRNSSVALEKSLIAGITAQGADVIKIGLSSTPMLYFASGKLDVDAGIIITASHNPAAYNGLKICRQAAVPVGEGSGMEEIRDLALAGNFKEPEKTGEVFENPEFRNEYLSYMKKFFDTKVAQNKNIAVDFANAMGIIDKPVFENLSAYVRASYLYDEFDGHFPHHEANPLKTETLEDLQKEVVAHKADLGIAYDGDADRVGFVDEKGEVVPMDYIIALIAKEILKKHPGSLILMDLRGSNAVKEAIEEAGGIVHHCRVGHSLIKKQMREEGAVFAGELSGHYYFQENFKAEMPTLAALMILNLLNQTGKKMSELIVNLKKYWHSGEINSEVRDKEGVFKKLKDKYKDGQLNELDGVRIDYPDWWFNVRASNTEPKMRLNLEAKTKELMMEQKDELLAIIRG